MEFKCWSCWSILDAGSGDGPIFCPVCRRFVDVETGREYIAEALGLDLDRPVHQVLGDLADRKLSLSLGQIEALITAEQGGRDRITVKRALDVRLKALEEF